MVLGFLELLELLASFEKKKKDQKERIKKTEQKLLNSTNGTFILNLISG